ncbi:unnamed protein product, partial [Coregonus sp. 'balchen']
MLHLVLEKGHLPADCVHAPLTLPCVPNNQQQQPQQAPEPSRAQKEYSFITDDNVFEVPLLKNSSGLVFSFSREETLSDETTGNGPVTGSSMVRVKKLFPGQPAALSGRINVGDIIIREVISALRGTGQEVTLLLCRPDQGTPMASPRKEPVVQQQLDPISSLSLPRTASPVGSEGKRSLGLGPVEEALESLLMKSPSRRDSYSDSTEDEEVEEAFSASLEQGRQAWDHSIYQAPSSYLALGRLSQYETPCELDLDDTIDSAYSPNLSLSNRSDLSR